MVEQHANTYIYIYIHSFIYLFIIYICICIYTHTICIHIPDGHRSLSRDSGLHVGPVKGCLTVENPEWFAFPIGELWLAVGTIPEGPSTQYLRLLVPKDHAFAGFWNQKPQSIGYLDPLGMRVVFFRHLFGMQAHALSSQDWTYQTT